MEDINSVHDLYEGDYNIQLKLCNRQTECYMTIKPISNCLALTPGLIKEKIAAYKIKVGIDENKLTEICERANQGKPVDSELIAQGTLPVPGIAAKLEFHIKPFSFDPDFEEDEQGKIDFKQCNLFENVGIGRHIAHWTGAVLGKNGQAVTGEVIPAKLVANFTVKAGRGIEERDGHEFYSTEKGRVILKNNELSISDEYIIDKDVDYSIGHVDFVGFVQVRGEVFDGFNIKAKKGIRVYKNVGASILHSEGDIEIAGMTGREHDAIINCGGNLTAKYLNNVYVECEGNVHIWKDVFNCIIKSKGRISVGGRMVGGEYIALGGIEAKQIGSEMGVKTCVIAGIDYHDLEKIKEYRSKLVETKTRWELWEIAGPIDKKNYCIKRWKALKPERKAVIIKFFKSTSEREACLTGKLQAIRESCRERSNPKLNIEKVISSSTNICLGNTKLDVKDEIKGPKSLIEFCGLEILVLEKTPLKKNAKEIEEKIKSRQEKKPEKQIISQENAC